MQIQPTQKTARLICGVVLIKMNEIMMKKSSPIIHIISCALILLIFPSGLWSESQTKENVYIPKNLEETFIELKKLLPPDDLMGFKETPENEIFNYHFSVGMGLRNKWGLWNKSRLAKYFNNIGIFHPDDMSMIIFKSFWRDLNNKPIQLESQIKYYQDFWKYSAPPEVVVSPIDGAQIFFILSQPCEDLTISEHCRVHFGVSKSDESPWAYQYGKGVFEPNGKDKKRIFEHLQYIRSRK